MNSEAKKCPPYGQRKLARGTNKNMPALAVRDSQGLIYSSVKVSHLAKWSGPYSVE